MIYQCRAVVNCDGWTRDEVPLDGNSGQKSVSALALESRSCTSVTFPFYERICCLLDLVISAVYDDMNYNFPMITFITQKKLRGVHLAIKYYNKVNSHTNKK